MTAMAPAPIALTRDLLTGAEWPASSVRDLFTLARNVKAHPSRFAKSLTGRYLAMIFEKPSLRTRTTFDVGMQSLGGGAVFLDHTQYPAWRTRNDSRRREKSRALGSLHRRAHVFTELDRRTR